MPDLAAALSYRRPARVRLDPRTGLGAIIVVNVVCLGSGFAGTALWARVVATALPLLLLTTQRRWASALVCVAATAGALAMETVGVDAVISLTPTNAFEYAGSLAVLIAGIAANFIARLLPVALIAWYVVTTTRVGELMGAMEKMHMPRAVVIPLAVVLRMVPVLASESSAIAESARTRGLRVGLARPSALVNYRIVPLTLRSVDIGDELTQAGLTRGLETSVKRTCLGRIGFGWPDLAVLAWAVASIWLFAMGA